MNESDIKISPSLFAPKKVSNLPRKPIDDLKARILNRYKELLTTANVNTEAATKASEA
jgi:hypothetical protein